MQIGLSLKISPQFFKPFKQTQGTTSSSLSSFTQTYSKLQYTMRKTELAYHVTLTPLHWRSA